MGSKENVEAFVDPSIVKENEDMVLQRVEGSTNS